MKKMCHLFLFLFNSAFCQTSPNLAPNKEYYEEIEAGFIPPNYSDLDPENGMQNRAGWLMMGYLNMYEATGDKAYLIKFVNASLECILNRYDVVNNFGLFSLFPPKWTLSPDGHEESTYLNNLLLIPMTKFIYLVRNDLDLYNTNLDGRIFHKDEFESKFSEPIILGYGDYANWLGARVEETMWYLNEHYWSAENGHLQYQDGTVAALNFQSFFATVFLYKYKINNAFGPWVIPQSTLLNRITTIKNHYLGIFDQCSFPQQVFVPQSNNSFGWWHSGWSSTGCEPYLKEDVAHGAMDLLFPMTDWELGTGLFTTTDFFNWTHETFTQNVYNGDGGFNNTVWGTLDGFTGADEGTACGIPYIPASVPNVYWSEVLAWMPLESFDSPHSVYDILINHTDELRRDEFHDFPGDICTNAKGLSGGQSYDGLSEVVKAQWKRECVDLTMTNRDLIYDQDFFAKGNLYIEPTITSTTTQKAFAEPNNTTTSGDPDYFNKNEYIVESGVKSHMKAGNGIHLFPGFSAKAGCDFRAYIDPSLCSGDVLDFRNTKQENSLTASTSQAPAILIPVNTKPTVDLLAYADNEKHFVNLSSNNANDKSKSLLITDMTGRTVQTYDYLPASVPTQNLTPAIYIFTFVTEKGKASQKVFVK
jgi:hypothetical protein